MDAADLLKQDAASMVKTPDGRYLYNHCGVLFPLGTDTGLMQVLLHLSPAYGRGKSSPRMWLIEGDVETGEPAPTLPHFGRLVLCGRVSRAAQHGPERLGFQRIGPGAGPVEASGPWLRAVSVAVLHAARIGNGQMDHLSWPFGLPGFDRDAYLRTLPRDHKLRVFGLRNQPED